MKCCTKCNQIKHINEFYKKSNRNTSYCKTCFDSYCVDRWIKNKQKAIDYKGSKCQDCSLEHTEYNYCVFDFHHRNPNEKETDWTKLRLKSWDKIVFEIDKCDLLCSNCHRMRHKKRT